MARYYQRPQAPIVDLTPKVPIEFYSNLINQAQQNLNQANVTGAAFMTDAYNQKFVDQAARDRAMALGQAPIEQALDRDFVTPAAMAKAVTQASAAMADWKNVNAKHLELVEREQKLRDTWGGNYIGNSVKSMSLINPETGEFIKPEDIKLTASNREDLVQALAKDNAGRADLKREFEGTWKTILGGKAFEKKNRKITGLTEQERVAEFVNNQAMAKQYLAQMPEFAAAIAASGVDPVDYMTKEIDQWSKQLVKGEDFSSQLMDNKDYQSGGGPTTTFGNGISLKKVMNVQEGDKELQTLLDNAKGKIANLGFGTAPSPLFGGLINTPTIDVRTGKNKDIMREASLEKLKEKFPLIAKKHSGEGGQFAPNDFLAEIENFINDPVYFNSVVDYQDPKIIAGLNRRILTTLDTGSDNNAMVIDEDGKKVRLSALKLKSTDMEVAQLMDNGNVAVRVDGKQYIINTTDKNNAGLSVFSTTEEPMIRFASALDKEQFKYFEKPKDLGDVTTIKSFLRDGSGRAVTDAQGNNIYYRPKYEIVTDPQTLTNYVIKTYLDPETLKPHYIGDNQPYKERMSLGEAKAEMFDFIGQSVAQPTTTIN